jgi:hypothetical protein
MMVDNDFPTSYANYGDVAQGTSPVNEDLYNWMHKTYGIKPAEWYRNNPDKKPGANPMLPRGAYVPLAEGNTEGNGAVGFLQQYARGVQDYSQEGTDIPSFSFENKYAQEQGGPIARSFKIGPRTIATPIDDVPVRGNYSLPSINKQIQNVNEYRGERGLGPITAGQFMGGV